MKCTVCQSTRVETRHSASGGDCEVLEFCHDFGTCFCPGCGFSFQPKKTVFWDSNSDTRYQKFYPKDDLSTETVDN